MLFIVFNVIGKKSNETSFSDAGREIPTLGSTDNAGNLVNLVSGIIRILRGGGGGSLSASETDDRFYLSATTKNNNNNKKKKHRMTNIEGRYAT